jgi:lipopolysaccharide transport system ATP-binding protein
MSRNAIEVQGIGKQYRLGGNPNSAAYSYKSLRDVLSGIPRRLLRRGPAPERNEMFWALKDVSFAVPEGQVVGLIGRNGAGKSTFLKVLSRVTEPTEGKIRFRGRIGSLLEVGTGFHPELTGRENILMNGAILGMRRAEIARHFDDIVAFAEVEKFIDTPVKHYSSGMYLRLAFAVAAHLDPEILLVDEVLAVGDAAFQKKCLGKMGDVSRRGRTVMFVSHNMTALRALCSRAVWFSEGKVMEDGPAGDVVDHYLQSHSTLNLESRWDDPATAPGDHRARLHLVRVNAKNTDTDLITVSTPLEVEFQYWNFLPGAVLDGRMYLSTLEEVIAFNVISEAAPRPAGLIRQTVEIPGNLLNTGTYFVSFAVGMDRSTVILGAHRLVEFEVTEGELQQGWYGRRSGVLRPQLRWSTEPLAAPGLATKGDDLSSQTAATHPDQDPIIVG